ncbi:MAG: hypothetical protein R6X32_18890, partial [Chloroflexota bacterium]
MSHKIYLVYLLIILGLTLLLTACLTTPLVVEGERPTPVVTLVVAEPSAEPSAEPTAELLATPDRTETAEPPSSTQPTFTPFVLPPPTNTPAPASGPPPTVTSPASTDPHFVTQDVTAVRVGPGLDYELSHFLGPGTTVMLAGRNAE